VEDTSGRKYSKKPLPLARAEKQLKALHIHTGHGLFGGNKWDRVRLIATDIEQVNHRNQSIGAKQRYNPPYPFQIGKYKMVQMRAPTPEPLPNIDERLQKLVKEKHLDQRDVPYYKTKIDEYLRLPTLFKQNTFKVHDPIYTVRQPEEILGRPGTQETAEERLMYAHTGHPHLEVREAEELPLLEEHIASLPTRREQKNADTMNEIHELLARQSLTHQQGQIQPFSQEDPRMRGLGSRYADPDTHILVGDLSGGGYWEDEYNRRANLIPGVNQKLLAEIGTDLKHRLARLMTTKFVRPLSIFGVKTNKERLVTEALDTLTRLSIQSNPHPTPGVETCISNTNSPGETYYYNPLNNNTTWEHPINPARPIEELVQESRTTGRLGHPIIRDNPPKYRPITQIDPRGIFDTESSEFKSILHLPFPSEFKYIQIQNYVIGTPIPWGKFNTVFISGRHPDQYGHVGVLIRNLTNPISYTWYDSHGTSWRQDFSFFNPWQEQLDSIVGNADVNFNDSVHQCSSSLCKSFAKIRATYPNLTNEQYNQELKQTAQQIANNPNFNVITTALPIYERDEDNFITKKGYVTPTDPKQILGIYSRNIPPAIPEQGLYAHRPGDVYAAQLVAEKVQEPLISNPQEIIPFIGQGNPQKTKKELAFLKRYLKGQGIPATKKNINKICNIMDVEGVLFE